MSGVVAVYTDEEAYDDFNREVAEIAQSASDAAYAVAWGDPWNLTKSGSNADALSGVSDGYGTFRRVAGGVGARSVSAQGWEDHASVTAATGFTLIAAIKATSVASLSEITFQPNIAHPEDLTIRIGSTGYIRFNLTDTLSLTSWVADAQYLVKWEHIPGDLSRAKIWLETDTEPDWMINMTTTTPTQPANGRLFLSLRLLQNASYSLKLDYINFGGSTPVLIYGR